MQYRRCGRSGLDLPVPLWDMWPGPYGQGGGSRKYLLASLDQSLQRLGLEYVDVFYSHRLDGTTPLEETIERLRALNQLASRRGQTLAQLALAWALRDERVTSLVIGASSVEQLEQNVDALDNLEPSTDDMAEIDKHTTADAGVDIWEQARAGEW